jgi:hypothetical protein
MSRFTTKKKSSPRRCWIAWPAGITLASNIKSISRVSRTVSRAEAQPSTAQKKAM